MRKTYFNFLWCLGLFSTEFFAQDLISLQYHHGYNVPAYDASPKTNRTSPFLAIKYIHNTQGTQGVLDTFYGGPQVHLGAFYQNLGNDQVMGFALGVIPELRFCLRKWEKAGLWGGGGMGLAWNNKPYDKNTNPTNQALGTPFNIYAQAALEVQACLREYWWLSAEIGVHHLSNSFFSFPNLGVNIPHLGISIGRILWDQGIAGKGKKVYVQNSHWRPSFRFIFGVTERGYDGPKYNVIGGGLALRKRYTTNKTVSFGGEYMFDESSYFFVKRASDSSEKAKKKAQRYQIYLGHEYHFGYFSLSTEAGYYLSNQFNQQSKISTKVGFNFFLFNQLHHFKHQFSLGVFIRAYFLRADFFEINANYRW